MHKTISPARRRLSLMLVALMGTTLMVVSAGNSAPIVKTVEKSQALSELAHDTSPPLASIPHVKLPAVDPLKRRAADIERRINRPQNPNAVGAPDTSGVIPNAKRLLPKANFEGMGDQPDCGCVPPDNDVAAGTTQVVEFINTDLQVWNKSGTSLLGPVSMATFWTGFPGSTCNSSSSFSDSVVLWDSLSSRWVIEILDLNNANCVAVSATTDATGSWHRYAFADPTGFLPDYTKVGVWPDAYYMSMDEFSNPTPYHGMSFCAIERSQMLAGLTARENCKTFQTNPSQLSTSYIAVMPGTIDGPTAPAAGTPEWFVGQDPTFNDNGYQDGLLFWKMSVNWGTNTSTLTGPTRIVVDEYIEACWSANAGTCVLQPPPGDPLDSLGEYMMFRLAYRNFGDHEAMVVTHSIDTGTATSVVNGDGDDAVGERWYELRPNGLGGLNVYQQGTYSPDQKFRWMGSAAMDRDGNIGLAYSRSSAQDNPGIYYTGHRTTDALGSMPIPETAIVQGTGTQIGAAGRWGDYSSLAVDPADDCTFWYENEYYNGTFSDWRTRVASFKFPSCGAVTNDFSIGASPSSVSLSRGSSTTTTISTLVTAGSAQSVNLSATGLPSGVTASFTPSTITAGQSSTMTINASAGATTGTAAVTVTGTGANATHTAGVSVTVLAGDDFSIDASPTSLTVTQGSSGAVSINTTLTNGSAQSIALTASGLPSGVTASFSSPTITSGGSSTLTLSASPSATPGLGGITVTGTGTATTHATIVNLTVDQPPSSLRFTPNLTLQPNSLNQNVFVQKDAEPTMTAANDGGIYINAPIGGGGGCHVWSVDKAGPTPTYLGQSDGGVGGADCDIAASLTPDPTLNPDKDLVAATSLLIQGAELHSSASFDEGATWVSNPTAAQTAADDRMWMSAGQADRPQEFFMTYRQAPGTGFLLVAKSVDGGLTYTTTGPPINNVTSPTSNFTSWEGNLVVDPRNSNNLYVIFLGTQAANRQNATVDQVVWLGSSHDGGTTWTETVIHDGGNGTHYNHIFPSLAMDQAGRLYATYSNGPDMFIATAPAPPASPEGVWTERTIQRPTLNGRQVVKASFPWITASLPGQADIAWYGSNDANSNVNSEWGLYFVRATNGIPGTPIKANAAPFHKGWICEGGGGCAGVTANGISVAGDRRMGDFLTVRDDAQGLAHIAFTHDPDCPCGASGQPDGRGSYIQYVREVPTEVDHIGITPSSSTITTDGSQSYSVQSFNRFGEPIADVTASATFAIAPNGSCTGAVCSSSTPGAHTVTANAVGKTATASLQINAGALSSIVISPSSATITAGGSQVYTAQGFDGSGNSVGDVTASTTFGIDNGTCTGASCRSTLAGARTVTGSHGSLVAFATLNVNPGPSVSLTLSPLSTSVPVGTPVVYTATGHDAYNNSTGDLTAGTTFAIAPEGSCSGNSCTANAGGSHTVTGTNGALVGTATLIAVSASVDHLVLSPASATVAAGSPQSYTAEGFDAQGNDLGDFSGSAVFTISPNGSCSGSSCTATVVGTHTVKAKVGAAIGTATLNVVAGPPARITLSPATATIVRGGTQAYTVGSTDQYGNPTGDVTALSLLTIAPDGSCTANRCGSSINGPHTVAAVYGTLTAQATLYVVPPAPVITAPAANAVLPPNVTVAGTAPAGDTVRLIEGGNTIADNVLADADGLWSTTLTFATGTHTIVAKAIEGTSVSGASLPRTFTVDASPPTVKVSHPSLYTFFGIYTPLDRARIKGSATDNQAVDHVEIVYTNLVTGTVVSKTADCNVCPAPSVLWQNEPGFGIGFYEASVVAVDQAGNRSAAETYDFLIL